MTIDEAIKHAREVAEKDRNQHKTGCLGHIEEYYDAKQRAEEHEQLAEWLEELKAIKGNEIPIIHGKEELELHDKEIRNKAIDDFKKLLIRWYQSYDIDLCLQDNDHFNYEDSRIAFESYIDEIAQQLKAGDSDEN